MATGASVTRGLRLIIRSWTILFAVLLSPACSSDQEVNQRVDAEADRPQLIAREAGEGLEAFLSRVIIRNDIPGAAVASFNSNGILEAAVVGTLCVGSEISVHNDSRFHIGSLAKSMTATIAAILVEHGQIDWNKTVSEVFPEWTNEINPIFLEVTLVDCLRHRSGLGPWWSDADEFRVHEIVPDLVGNPVEQRAKFSQWILSQEEHVSPGNIQYSNAGYVLAAAMLERVTGKSWEVLFKELLFEPLALKHTGFGWPRDTDEKEPCGHLRHGSEYRAAPPQYHRLPSLFTPSGDVHMSLADLVRFGTLHLMGLHGNNGLLKSETVRFIHDPVGDYACGWGSGSSPSGERVSDHEGGAGTFFAFIVLSHDRDVGCVFLANVGADGARFAAASACLSLLSDNGKTAPATHN